MTAKFLTFVLAFTASCFLSMNASANPTTEIIGKDSWWTVGTEIQFLGDSNIGGMCSCSAAPNFCSTDTGFAFREVTTGSNCSITSSGSAKAGYVDGCFWIGDLAYGASTCSSCDSNNYCESVWEITNKLTCGIGSGLSVYTVELVCEQANPGLDCGFSGSVEHCSQ